MKLMKVTHLSGSPDVVRARQACRKHGDECRERIKAGLPPLASVVTQSVVRTRNGSEIVLVVGKGGKTEALRFAQGQIEYIYRNDTGEVHFDISGQAWAQELAKEVSDAK